MNKICHSCGEENNNAVQCLQCEEEGLHDYSADKDHQEFVRDMHNSDLTCQHYNGRFFYKGPACVVDSVEEARSRTKVQTTSDNMGLGFIVYPRF